MCPRPFGKNGELARKALFAAPDPNRKTNGGTFRYRVGHFLANQSGKGGLPMSLRNAPSERSFSSSMESQRWQLPKNKGRGGLSSEKLTLYARITHGLGKKLSAPR